MKKLLLAALVLTFPATCLAKPQPHVVLYVDDVISANSIAPLSEALRKIVVSKTDTNIDIVINSPGGEIESGMAFVNLMASARAQGSTITCYVEDIAASMAFQILTQCSKRYALPASMMLWHGVRMQTRQPITVTYASQLARLLTEFDQLIKWQLYSTLKLPRKDVDKAFEDELLWTGVSLHKLAPDFVTLKMDYSELLPEAENGIRMAKNPLQFLFGGSNDTIMYIWSGYIK
jgi:ATP-dependent protease ClpP protease subunit